MLHWLWLSLSVLLADQATKYLASSNLAFNQPLAVLPSFNLTLAHNRGAAFGILSDAPGWQRWFFTVLTVVVVSGLLIWLRRLERREWPLAGALALIIGGAVGNLVDRLRFGYVVDFLDVYVGSYHWPTFNIADSAISVGAVGILLLSLRAPAASSSDSARDS